MATVNNKCKDCIFVDKHNSPWICNVRIKTIEHELTGEVTREGRQVFCHHERENAKGCGHSGKFFEPINPSK